MITPDEMVLKSIITLQGNSHFARFIDWIRICKEQQIRDLIIAKGDRRDSLQGSIPELEEIVDTVTNAKKLMNQYENIVNRKPDLG